MVQTRNTRYALGIVILLSINYVANFAFFELYETISYLIKLDKILTIIEAYHYFRIYALKSLKPQSFEWVLFGISNL